MGASETLQAISITPHIIGDGARCLRCTRDRKGCDRKSPCGRCANDGETCEKPTNPIAARRGRKPSTSTTNGTSASRTGERAFKEDKLDNCQDTPLSKMPARKRKVESAQGDPVARSSNRRRSAVAAAMDSPKSPPILEFSTAETELDRTESELNRLRILRSYTDIITHLPIDIYRSTSFIRALDSSYASQTKELDDLCRNLQQCQDLALSLSLRSKICKLMRRSKQDRSETIAEIGKLQNLVDSQINVLSTEIDKIENPQNSMPVFEEAHVEAVAMMKQKRQRKTGGLQDSLDVPIEDDEPTYCYCGRVSFGKMIACENDDCEGGEWFHFACLDIKSAPKGKWYCSVCQELGKPGHAGPSVPYSTKKKSKVRGETAQEKRTRIREENKAREISRRSKLSRSRR